MDTENLPKYGIYYNSSARVVVVDLAIVARYSSSRSTPG